MNRVHIHYKKQEPNKGNANIMDLIRKNKLEEKKEKKKTVLLSAIAIFALAMSGYIISQ